MVPPPEDGATKDHDGPGAVVAVAWLGFLVTVVAAAFFDVLVLSKKGGQEAALAAATALQEQANAEEDHKGEKAAEEKGKNVNVAFVRQILFWLCTSVLFNCFVWGLLGAEAAGSWTYGYILEYMLSVDNLFVFRMVFQGYSTPPAQVDRALFWGVAVAVILRLIFFGIGTEILGLGFIARCFFGLALVYSGVKTVRNSDDDDDNPKDNCCVKNIARLLPLYDDYSKDARFFIRVSDDGDGVHAPSPSKIGKSGDTYNGFERSSMIDDHVATYSAKAQESITSTPQLAEVAAADAAAGTCVVAEVLDGGNTGGTIAGDRLAELQLPAAAIGREGEMPRDGQGQAVGKPRRKVTMLFLVVLTLAIIDVIFAVDSVTAKISSVAQFSLAKNLFLNLSSSAFAMFVLRSVYFLLDMMVHMFRFLNYGVGVVLILIGVKLMLSTYVEIGMVESLASILAILVVSVLISWMFPEKEEEPSPAGEGAEQENTV